MFCLVFPLRGRGHMAFQEGKVQEQQEHGHHITRAYMVLSTVVIAQQLLSVLAD